MNEPKVGDVMFYDGLYVLYTGKNNEYLFKGVVIWDDSCDDTVGRYADCWRRKAFVIKKVTITIQDADIDIEAAFQKENGDGE